MKKIYLVPKAEIVCLKQQDSILAVSGDLYNGLAGAPELEVQLPDFDEIEADLNSEIDKLMETK